MTMYFRADDLKEAVERLSVSVAKPKVGDYLVFKRALTIRLRERDSSSAPPVPPSVVTGIQSLHFLRAHIDIGLRFPQELVRDLVGGDDIVDCMSELLSDGAGAKEKDPRLASPYFVPFGAKRDKSKGYRRSKWPSNGPSDTVSRWQGDQLTPILYVSGTSPKEYTLGDRTEAELKKFFYGDASGSNWIAGRPRLIDTAVWWFRYLELEDRFGHAPSGDELSDAFVDDLGLSTVEVSAIFDTEEALPSNEQVGAILDSRDDGEIR